MVEPHVGDLANPDDRSPSAFQEKYVPGLYSKKRRTSTNRKARLDRLSSLEEIPQKRFYEDSHMKTATLCVCG
jgi:hypothetical protein